MNRSINEWPQQLHRGLVEPTVLGATARDIIMDQAHAHGWFATTWRGMPAGAIRLRRGNKAITAVFTASGHLVHADLAGELPTTRVVAVLSYLQPDLPDEPPF